MARMGEDVAQGLREHIDRIGHIQFADTPGRHEPGTGELDFTQLFGLIAELPYSGFCAAEYRPQSQTEAGLDWLRLYQNKETP